LSERIHLPRHLLGSVLVLATLVAAQSAQAQTEPPVDTWKFNLGVGLIQHQDYPGSSAGKVSLRPLFGASYGRWARCQAQPPHWV